MGVYNYHGSSVSNVAYDYAATLLNEAYDVAGNPLFDHGTVIINPDASSGTDSGMRLTIDGTSTDYVLREMVDFFSDDPNLQSFAYDRDSGLYYKFNGGRTVKVYSAAMQLVNTITLPTDAGHNNDACIIDGITYFPNLNTNDIVTWNIANNAVSSISITGIPQPTSGSERRVDALCETEPGSGQLYLACRDVAQAGDIYHLDTDKLSVYRYTLQTGRAELMGELPWDCVFIQGCVAHDGVLYIACNTQTTGAANNYTGITVKAIRTDTWAQLDPLICAGNFEPEGMDIIPAGNGFELMMGIAHWSNMCKATRFTPPYALVNE